MRKNMMIGWHPPPVPRPMPRTSSTCSQSLHTAVEYGIELAIPLASCLLLQPLTVAAGQRGRGAQPPTVAIVGCLLVGAAIGKEAGLSVLHNRCVSMVARE